MLPGKCLSGCLNRFDLMLFGLRPLLSRIIIKINGCAFVQEEAEKSIHCQYLPFFYIGSDLNFIGQKREILKWDGKTKCK